MPSRRTPSPLKSVDLDRRIPRDEYKRVLPDLERRLGRLQRQAIVAGLPVVVVFEGWEAAGKGSLINRFIRALDPRHFHVHSIQSPGEEERLRPPLWRYWLKLPPAGAMAVLDRSWYGRVLQRRVDHKVERAEWERAFEEIAAFERTLTDAGVLLIKLFLHISRGEQKKRFRALESTPETSWRITREDWIHHEHYDAFRDCADEMLTRSCGDCAPWRVVAAQDRRTATVEVFGIIADAIEQALAPAAPPEPPPPAEEPAVDPLARIDLSRTVTREEYDSRLDDLQEEIFRLEHEIYVRRVPVVIVYEGWDAAGKGGNIRRLTQSMDPRGYDVIPIAAPTPTEKRHHYLWRFWKEIPKAGHVAIFDRSWYGRVLVERVEGFCSEAEWRRAYREINEFEKQLVDFGTVLVKFWLHIDSQEQLRRFRAREQDPDKLWKINDEDWRNRGRWDDYLAAVRDMLARTGTEVAPWTVVESNSKHFARLKALETVVAAIRAKDR